WVQKAIRELISAGPEAEAVDQSIKEDRSSLSPQYVFAILRASVIQGLVVRDIQKQEETGGKFNTRAIYHIWPDFEIRALTNKSISTVKADAARASFAALGEGIVWAVLDSGIALDHPHFELHANVQLDSPLVHIDFTGRNDAQTDPCGHGTHVAGIIAGEMSRPSGAE